MEVLRVLTGLFALFALQIAACEPTTPPPAQDAETLPEVTNPFTCELGVVNDDGHFEPFGAGSKLELVLGFQGLLFITIVARLDGDDPPDEVDCHLGLRIDTQDVPLGLVQPNTGVNSTASGEWVSTDIVLFLDGGSAEPYTGLHATISSRLVGPHGFCTAEAFVELVDDDPCIHAGEKPICPGDEPTR